MTDVQIDLSAPAREAIQRAGGGAALARGCGVTRFAVNQWRRRGIPADRVGDVSRITGIPAAELRPDLAAAFAPTQPGPLVAA
jgi:DNA-binding transcriptional regulator YdaS (Cro superfamily)